MFVKVVSGTHAIANAITKLANDTTVATLADPEIIAGSKRIPVIFFPLAFNVSAALSRYVSNITAGKLIGKGDHTTSTAVNHAHTGHVPPPFVAGSAKTVSTLRIGPMASKATVTVGTCFVSILALFIRAIQVLMKKPGKLSILPFYNTNAS